VPKTPNWSKPSIRVHVACYVFSVIHRPRSACNRTVFRARIAIDRDDRVYITTVTGVQVFDAKGQYLGTIKVARQPANAAFAGPDKQTLYITAREGLYRVRTLVKGPDQLGK